MEESRQCRQIVEYLGDIHEIRELSIRWEISNYQGKEFFDYGKWFESNTYKSLSTDLQISLSILID